MKWSDIPALLRSWREATRMPDGRTMTQTDVAKRLGITKGAVSNIETGKRGLDSELAEPWAAIFGRKVVLEVVPQDWHVAIRPAPNGEAELSPEDRALVEQLSDLLQRLPHTHKEAIEAFLDTYERFAVRPEALRLVAADEGEHDEGDGSRKQRRR